NVFRRPIRIAGRNVSWNDAVLESRGLERRLPIDDRLSDPRLPLIGRVRIDVVDDRLLRVAEIALFAIRALETPARDERSRRCHLIRRAEINGANREEARALVG